MHSPLSPRISSTTSGPHRGAHHPPAVFADLQPLGHANFGAIHSLGTQRAVVLARPRFKVNDLDEAERQMNSNGRVVFSSANSRLASLAAKGAPPRPNAWSPLPHMIKAVMERGHRAEKPWLHTAPWHVAPPQHTY